MSTRTKHMQTFEFVREDDFVEYFLFPKLNNTGKDDESVKSELENIFQQIKQVIENHTQNYIWHKDEFNLTSRTGSYQYHILDEDDNEKKENLPPHLYGITHYGDNIQDEWFIVFLLYEITKKIPGIIGRVMDSDGEFLLIEAAEFLPKWANPDTCEQRVYIYDGHLQLVQDENTRLNEESDLLQVSIAIEKIHENPTLYRVSNEIQTCIDERLKDFTADVGNNLYHYQNIRVPISAAALLKENPALIAPACRAFCERDSIDMKACRAMRYFPPENRVRITVKFTRCLYAMIMHNNYVPDRWVGWNLPLPGTEEYKEDLLGIKIACGFEILASQAKDDDNDVENDRNWKTFLNSLVRKGYFNDNLEGSKDYCRLLEEAKVYYKENLQKFRTFPVVGKEVLHLLRTLDFNSEQLKNDENNLRPSDDDNWLNISPEELDAMLTKKYGVKRFFNANGINASEFTENIVEFLDKKSEFDGIDIDSSSSSSPSTTTTATTGGRKGIKKNLSMRKAIEEHPIRESTKQQKQSQSNDINFDPDAFQTHVKNFLDFVIPEDDWESNSEMSDYEDENDLEKNLEDMEKTKMNINTDIKMYMDQMDRELRSTTIGKTFETSKRNSDDLDDFDDIENFKPIDIDVNTLRNMVDSYKSQFGGPGPATTLLGAMNMGISEQGEKNEENKDENPINMNGTQV